MDMRYFAICETEGNSGRGASLTGGSAGVSTRETIQDSYRYLRRKWGFHIIRIGKGKQRGAGYAISVKIPQKFEDTKHLLGSTLDRRRELLNMIRR